MAKQTLAVKYRPSTFDDVVEQSAIKDILQDQIETETFQHSYLFCGPAGCGKTTAARIFANDINQGKGNPIEVDAASNNGVDNVRDIIEGARRKPLDCSYKTYIIDECFAPSTMVSTPSGPVKIKDIRAGDVVQHMTGYGRVTNVFNTKVLTSRLCCVTINSQKTFTTAEHLFFTDSGWVKAKNLRRGDRVYVSAQMFELWERVREREEHLKVLQSRLFDGDESQETCKMEDSELCCMREALSSEAQFSEEDLLRRLQEETHFYFREEDNAVRLLFGPVETVLTKNADGQSYERLQNYSENVEYKGEEWDPASVEGRKRGKWEVYDTADSFVERIRHWMGVGVRDTHKAETELSFLLQSRPRLSFDDARSRGGWQRTSLERAIISGLKKDGAFEDARVDSVEIYKPGYNDELFRSCFADTKLHGEYVTMYDLEVEHDHTYFANNVLVHNCHMLSIGAWNAMLKLLEEPPATAIFIMCTTDPQKIPATILSRVQRYNFSKISLDSIVNRLKYIVNCENDEIVGEGGPDDAFFVEEEAIQYIAKLADGGMRDSITMLDKCLSLTSNVTVQDAVRALGTVDYGTHFELLFQMECGNKMGAVEIIEKVYNSGKDLKQFIKQFQYFVLDVCKFCTFHDFKYVNIPALPEYQQRLEDDDRDMALAVLEWVRDLNSGLRWEANPKAIVESSIFLFNPPEWRE